MADSSQIQRTPGGPRRRGPPKPHQPFQHDELARGKCTVKVVRRNEEDMEDFDALMMSGGTSVAAGRARARHAAARPNPSPLPSAIGARSRAGRHHSTVDYDEIPSPGMSRTTRRRSSAPPTNKRTPTSNRRGADVDEDDEDTNLLGSAATSRATLRTTIRPDAGSRRKTGNTLLPQGEVDDDDGGVDEIEEIADPSPSTTRRRRTRRSEAADEEEVASPDRRGKGKGKGKGGRAVDQDDPDHDAEPIHDDDNAPRYDDDDDGMTLNDADEEAMAEENGEVAGDEEEDEPASQEEDEEDGTSSPPPNKKQGWPRKGEAVKELAMRRRAEQPGKSRNYERGVSEVIDVHAEGQGHYYDEQGWRRNARVRYGPLEHWRNEKVVYGRRQSGVAVVPVIKQITVIKQIIKVAPDPVRPVGGTHKRPYKRKSVDDNGDDDDAPLVKRKRSEPVYHDAEEPPEKGCDKQTDPLGVVIEYVTRNEVERRIAFTTESMIEPREAANARFRFQFLAAGMLSIPIGETKPAKSSKENSYVFYVIQGAVKVQIYRTSFLISVGGMFLVPRGNVYSIENVAERETILFFSQARKIPEDGSVSMHDSQGTPIKRHASMTPAPSEGRFSVPPRSRSDNGDIPSTGRSAPRATSLRPNGNSRRPRG
ncbi:hypothetical protein CALCODRAFT_493192 [Calocera cornea HHB12733]|uniref:CENP-C homolog n=1 Tax=Calocera cornea HHB12733 TaxID=1353952 RepID=A0A165HYW9_9BASI|nr:hypothetical protein CALCODRAFT_493192 [Calocera cornea HHB12733]